MPRDFVITCGEFILEGTPGGLPESYDALRAHAALSLERSLDGRDLCCLTVQRSGEGWPFLVVALGCPAALAGRDPRALIAREVLFVAHGDRLLVCALRPPSLLREECGAGVELFEQHGEVLLVGEISALSAWSAGGSKRWRLDLSPPWSHRLAGGRLEVTDAQGRREFPLQDGPREA